MKKTIYSLAAMMFMAAPVMTSCSNDLAEEISNNVMTITIAPPEPESGTRVATEDNINSIKITGWEENDIVTLYKIKNIGFNEEGIDGTGKEFKCTDATNGTFTCTDWGTDNINDYNLAVFGATADVMELPNSSIIVLKPKYRISTQLKDVIMLVAKRQNNSYKMMFANNIVKIQGFNQESVPVAWYGKVGTLDYGLFIPTVQIDIENISDDRLATGVLLENLQDDSYTFDDVKLTLNSSSEVYYLNMCLPGGDETWFLGKKNATSTSNQILRPKFLDITIRGKLYTATYPK